MRRRRTRRIALKNRAAIIVVQTRFQRAIAIAPEVLSLLPS